MPIGSGGGGGLPPIIGSLLGNVTNNYTGPTGPSGPKSYARTAGVNAFPSNSSQLKLNDYYTIAISFNGIPFLLTPFAIQKLEIIENIKLVLPTIEFILHDVTGDLVDKNAIGDGTIMSIYLDDGHNTDVTKMEFRLFHVEAQTIQEFIQIKGCGYLNKPKYLRKLAIGSYPGKSNEAVRKAAEEADLKVETDTFDDKMVWISLHQWINDFIFSVVDHGWAGESSATSVGVDTTGTLHYKDLEKNTQKGAKSKYIYGPMQGSKESGEPQGTTTHTCLHWSIDNYGGALNMIAAYDMQTLQLTMDGELEQYETVGLSSMTGFLNMDDELKRMLGPTKVVYKPIDAGNVHKNYARAEHTNLRGRAAWNLNLYALTDSITKHHLYDNIEMEIYNNAGYQTSPQKNSKYSGKYMCSAKITSISMNKLFEKTEMSTHGIQENPNMGAYYSG